MCKKEDNLSKENYHPAGVLLNSSEIFERIVFKQRNLFSNLQSGTKYFGPVHNVLEKLPFTQINRYLIYSLENINYVNCLTSYRTA